MYIRNYFESLFAIYLVACWFVSSKIQLVSCTRKLSQTFSPDLLEKICCPSEHFVENEKEGNQLVYGLLNIVDGIEQKSQNSIFFSCAIIAECGLVLSSKSAMFLLLMSTKRFLGWLIGFYGISTFVSYLTPNPFLFM